MNETLNRLIETDIGKLAVLSMFGMVIVAGLLVWVVFKLLKLQSQQSDRYDKQIDRQDKQTDAIERMAAAMTVSANESRIQGERWVPMLEESRNKTKILMDLVENIKGVSGNIISLDTDLDLSFGSLRERIDIVASDVTTKLSSNITAVINDAAVLLQTFTVKLDAIEDSAKSRSLDNQQIIDEVQQTRADIATAVVKLSAIERMVTPPPVTLQQVPSNFTAPQPSDPPALVIPPPETAKPPIATDTGSETAPAA
jgi:hypothetical protein